MRVGLILLGALGVLDTVFVSQLSNMNLGVLLPGLIGLPLLLLGIFYTPFLSWAKTGIGKLVKWLLICGYGLAAIAFLCTGLLIHRAANRPLPLQADVLVVLGAGLRGERPTMVLTKRLDTAKEYLDAHPETIAILSGGKGDGETISEAEAMFRYLKQHGVPEERCIKEDASTNTRENFAYSQKLIRERFGQDASIAFVTTDFHVCRAGMVAKKQGIDAVGIPAPDVWYIKPNNVLRECVAIWAYWLSGRI